MYPHPVSVMQTQAQVHVNMLTFSSYEPPCIFVADTCSLGGKNFFPREEEKTILRRNTERVLIR